MYYFAYGSNLNQKQMKLRCPGSVPVCAATLPGYCVTERQYADIDWCGGKRVCGGLWRITEADLAALDRYEGYPNFYWRYSVWLDLPDGNEVEAWVYEMTAKAKLTRNGIKYSPYYRQICATGAADFGITTDF
ncbi:MAG: gamma-glutamylcyclotransferase family protein [Lentisphaerota bacterium]